MNQKSNVITVRVSDEIHGFLIAWKQKMEAELGIEVPMGALVRQALDQFFMENRHRLDREDDLRSHSFDNRLGDRGRAGLSDLQGSGKAPVSERESSNKEKEYAEACLEDSTR